MSQNKKPKTGYEKAVEAIRNYMRAAEARSKESKYWHKREQNAGKVDAYVNALAALECHCGSSQI